MEIEVRVGNESLTLHVDNPFRINPEELSSQIKRHFSRFNIDNMDIEGLLPKMVRGVFGCEEGCPADAKRLVSEGYKDFQLEYIEGGILSASCKVNEKDIFSIKVFPEF
jgi:hypothetical protein